jgi:hypothetical protein
MRGAFDFHFVQEIRRMDAESASNMQELNKINSPLSILIFRDEGLRLSKPLS